MKSSVPILFTVNLSDITHEYTVPAPLHRHSVWELIIYERGMAQNIVNGKCSLVSIGDVFLLGPMHLHELCFDTKEHLHRDIYFSENVIKEVCDTYSPKLFYRLSEETQPLSLKLASPCYETVTMLCSNLDTMNAALATDGSVSEQALCGVARSVLNIIISLFYTQLKIEKITTPSAILEIITKLQRPEHFTLPVAEIVSEFNYSHSYFLKLFKEYTGITIIQYLNQLRVSYAAELLRNSDAPVLEICEQCGYLSLSYFIKTFKKQYGKTPLLYRKEIRSEKYLSDMANHTVPS